MNRATHHTQPKHLPHQVPVIYHDDYLVFVNKPSGLLSVRGIGLDKMDCLEVRVASAIEGARIVHRLDMDTSGIIVLARDADTHRELSRQFREREVKKEYFAVVGGCVQKEKGTIDIPIRKDMENPPKQCVDEKYGKPSITKYEVLFRSNQSTRLLLKPITGRSHQIRIHLRELGHPILGDDLYANHTFKMMSNRLLLHASKLSITHPATKKSLVVEVDCPF